MTAHNTIIMDKDDIQFQIIDISSDDVPIGTSYWDREFKITIYGKTKEGKNVVANVVGFKPFFYIRVVNGWSESYAKSFLEKVTKFTAGHKPNAKNNWKGEYVSIDKQRYKNFYGFNYDPDTKKVMEYNFIKIEFNTYGNMRNCITSITDFYNYNYDLLKIIKRYVFIFQEWRT